MTKLRPQYSLIAVIAGALALSACGKNEEHTAPPTSTPPTTTSTPPPVTTPAPVPAPAPVAVASVDLGNAVGADQRVTTAATSFTPQDTIYAAVSTTGSAANAVLNAKWTYQDGQTVNESSQTIAPSGPAVTTFHISKPDGWPVGTYQVEVAVDGKTGATKAFKVQ